MVEGPGAVAPGPEGYGITPSTGYRPGGGSAGSTRVIHLTRQGCGDRFRDRRPPSFRWDCGYTRNIHRRGDQTAFSLPFSSITTYLHPPCTASPCRNPEALPVPSRRAVPTAGPDLDPGSCCHAITCSGSSSSATSTRLASLSTRGTLPRLSPKIYFQSGSFSVLGRTPPEWAPASARGSAGTCRALQAHRHVIPTHSAAARLRFERVQQLAAGHTRQAPSQVAALTDLITGRTPATATHRASRPRCGRRTEGLGGWQAVHQLRMVVARRPMAERATPRKAAAALCQEGSAVL